ncbi:MAG: DNA polymerase III subunit gamma/tau [Microgenomates group bacterium]
MSFYRTYRPQLIDEIDNVHVREQVHSLLQKDVSELPHAYLLTGPKGAGKTTTARILAKLYNCEKTSKKTGPCGTCQMCTSIANGTNMDVLEIDAASNRGIDEIRELRDRIALASIGGGYKIYIIDEVHMLTTEAFNALLKTLEEPPKHAVFILATTDPQKVPATIKSRCISIVFRKANDTELLSALKKIVLTEKMDITDDALQFIVSEADGAFRDAVKILEQVSFSKGKITIDTITDLFSSSGDDIVSQFLDALSKKDEKAAFALIEKLTNESKDIKGFITDVLHKLQEMLVILGKGDTLSGWNKTSVQHASHCFIDAYGMVKNSPIAELPLELAVFDYFGQGIAPTQLQQSKPAGIPSVEMQPAPKPKLYEGGEMPSPVSEEHSEIPAKKFDESFTVEKLQEYWKDIIEALKPFNHSVAGVMRSARPKTIHGDVLTIETQYKFHQERLSEVNVRDMLSTVLKKLFGVHVKVEVVLA